MQHNCSVVYSSSEGGSVDKNDGWIKEQYGKEGGLYQILNKFMMTGKIYEIGVLVGTTESGNRWNENIWFAHQSRGRKAIFSKDSARAFTKMDVLLANFDSFAYFVTKRMMRPSDLATALEGPIISNMWQQPIHYPSPLFSGNHACTWEYSCNFCIQIIRQVLLTHRQTNIQPRYLQYNPLSYPQWSATRFSILIAI